MGGESQYTGYRAITARGMTTNVGAQKLSGGRRIRSSPAQIHFDADAVVLGRFRCGGGHVFLDENSYEQRDLLDRWIYGVNGFFVLRVFSLRKV